MRLGRSYAQYDLRRPQVVFAPDPPTQQQQTIGVTSVAVNRRVGDQRRFPRQGWVGGVTAATDGAVSGAPSRLVGIWPPEVTVITPSQQQQTITTKTVAVSSRRATERARSRYQGWLGRTAAVQGTNVLVDDFSAPNSGWKQLVNTNFANHPMALSGGLFVGVLGGSASFYSAAGYVDVEVAATVASIGSQVAVVARAQIGAGGIWSFYAVETDGSRLTLVKLATAPTILRTVLGLTIVPGDQIAIRVTGSKLESRWKSHLTGQWQVIGTATDTTITGIGYPGVGAASTADSISDFSLGLFNGPDFQPLTSMNIGVFPPMVILPSFVPTQEQQTITVATAVGRRVIQQRAFPRQSWLGAPRVLAVTPSITLGAPATQTVRTRPRHTLAFYSPLPPVATTTFIARPVAVFSTRIRPRTTKHSVEPLIFHAQTGTIGMQLQALETRESLQQRAPRSALHPPRFYAQTSTLSVHLVKTRPHPTTKRLTYVVYPKITRIAETEIAVTTVVDDRRRRQTRSRIQAPVFYPQTSSITVTRVRTRPRPTTHFFQRAIVEPPLQPPDRRLKIVTALVRTRPRPTRRLLGPLVFYAQTSTISLTRTRIRPPRTRTLLAPPILAQPPVVTTLAVHLARTRPRPTTRFLRTPIVEASLRPPDRRLEVAVSLVRARPRHTTHSLGPLIFYAQTIRISVAQARIRPRRTTHFFTPQPPTAAAPVVTTVAVHTTRTRPRPTSRFLRTPISEPPLRAPDRRLKVATTLIRTRPRHTVSSLTNVVYRATSVIRVHTVRTRPRPTTHTGLTLTTYRRAGSTTIRLTRTRPRHTVWRLAPPTVVIPPPALAVQTIKVKLAGRTRVEVGRRAPHSFLRAPTAVTPPPEERERTISVTLVAVSTRTGLLRRRPHTILRPPAVVQPITGFEFRVAAPPSSAWVSYRMSSGWEESDPETGIMIGKPDVDWTTEPPDSDIQAGKPQ